MKILRFWCKVSFRCNKQFMQRLQFVNTSLLKVWHEHILPQNNNLAESLLKWAVIKNDTSDWMWWLDFLNLLWLSIWVFDLFTQLTDISPVLIDRFCNEFLFLLILPKQWWVGPFIFCWIFCDLIAPFV